MNKEKAYDLVMCVGPQHLDISMVTLKYIIKHLSASRIYLIISKEYFHIFDKLCLQYKHIKCIDEQHLENIHFDSIQNFLKLNTGNINRTGWYFQQFLKMEACKIVESEYYLIWDADTIPLQKIDFFTKDHQILIQTTKEDHQPYFETLKNMLNIDKQVPYSFISEHMMVCRTQMKAFIQSIQSFSSNDNWPLYILSKINKTALSLSGFSEYESFGNYLSLLKPSSIVARKGATKLKTYRFGTQIFGKNPSENDLQLLKKMGYSYVTFEVWDTQILRIIRRNKRLANLCAKISSYKIFSFLEKYIVWKIKKQVNK